MRRDRLRGRGGDIGSRASQAQWRAVKTSLDVPATPCFAAMREPDRCPSRRRQPYEDSEERVSWPSAALCWEKAPRPRWRKAAADRARKTSKIIKGAELKIQTLKAGLTPEEAEDLDQQAV